MELVFTLTGRACQPPLQKKETEARKLAQPLLEQAAVSTNPSGKEEVNKKTQVDRRIK